MRNLLILSAVAMAVGANAGQWFYDSALTQNSPTYTPSHGQSGPKYYEATLFQVTVTGSYIFEMTSPNTSGSPSNALDTYLIIADNTWNAASNPDGGIITFNDDFTGTLTVLPGPYGAFITNQATGWTGDQPGSRIPAANLTAGTDYWMVNTTYWTTITVNTGTGGQPYGPFYVGAEGPGDLIVVPEPATFIAVGIGLAGLAFARRRK